ncbi:MAG: hypothetical protein AAFX79_04780 [Planctomycetota bacterium]
MAPMNRGGRYWALLALVGAMVLVNSLGYVAFRRMHQASRGEQAACVNRLHQLVAPLQLSIARGASVEEAIASAERDGLSPSGGTAARVAINPDRDDWIATDRDAPVLLLVALQRFDDCYVLPGGRGKPGYYGVDQHWRIQHVVPAELPAWAAD